MEVVLPSEVNTVVYVQGTLSDMMAVYLHCTVGVVPANIPDILPRQAQRQKAAMAAVFGPVCSEGFLHTC